MNLLNINKDAEYIQASFNIFKYNWNKSFIFEYYSEKPNNEEKHRFDSEDDYINFLEKNNMLCEYTIKKILKDIKDSWSISVESIEKYLKELIKEND